MANRYLRPILDQLFGETFLHDYPYEERMRMAQAAVYLLKVTGFPLEEYSYRWLAEYGPASRMLTQDLTWGKAFPMKLVNFRKEYSDCISRLREVMTSDGKGEYTIADWLQCMAAFHYLRTYVMKWGASANEVISEVERRISRLNCRAANIAAANWVEKLTA